MTRRIFSAALAGLLLLAAACTGDESSPASDASASPTAKPTAPAEPSPSADTAPSDEPTQSTPDPSATPSGPEDQALLDRVRDEGTLSVIVEVALNGTAALNSPEERRLINQAQDDLIAELDPAHAEVTTRFRYNPQLALTVDEEGLRALFASSRVVNVSENESIPLD